MKAGWFWAGIEDFPLARPVSSLGPPKPHRISRAGRAWEAVQRPQAMAAMGLWVFEAVEAADNFDPFLWSVVPQVGAEMNFGQLMIS